MRFVMLFLIATVITVNLIVYFIPKKISNIDMYVSSLLAVILASLADLYLDVKLLWYWYFSKEIEWSWLILLLGGIPSFTILYMNFFPFYKNVWIRTLYIICWSTFFTGFELISVYIAGILHYGKWNIGYSALCYPVLLLLLYLNCLLIRKWIKKDIHSQHS
jgi:hypothetical protein